MQDPAWSRDFEEVIRFHGHVCGGLAIGYRAAQAAIAELGVERAEDEELVAIVENDSCAVDAIQVLTGCTMGKGNLQLRDYGKMVMTLFRRDEHRGVRVSRKAGTRGLTPEELLDMSAEDLFELSEADIPLPPPARIRDSEPCEMCGEPTMVTRLRQTEKGLLCVPCAEKV